MHDYLNNRLEELGITKETCPKFLHPDLFSWKALPPGVMIFFAKTLMFYASTPEQVDAVLRSALLTYPSNINYVKPKHAVYIGFFMYGVSCPLEQSWQSPDGTFGYTIVSEEYAYVTSQSKRGLTIKNSQYRIHTGEVLTYIERFAQTWLEDEYGIKPGDRWGFDFKIEDGILYKKPKFSIMDLAR